MKKRRREPDECELLIWHVPRELRDRFKAACAKIGKPMREVILLLMEGFLQDRQND